MCDSKHQRRHIYVSKKRLKNGICMMTHACIIICYVCLQVSLCVRAATAALRGRAFRGLKHLINECVSFTFSLYYVCGLCVIRMWIHGFVKCIEQTRITKVAWIKVKCIQSYKESNLATDMRIENGNIDTRLWRNHTRYIYVHARITRLTCWIEARMML